MIASTTSGGGCRGGARSRFVNLGMLVLAHVMLPGSRHGCPGRAADAFACVLPFCNLTQLDVVIFASSNLCVDDSHSRCSVIFAAGSNLCVQFCVSTTSRARRRPVRFDTAARALRRARPRAAGVCELHVELQKAVFHFFLSVFSRRDGRSRCLSTRRCDSPTRRRPLPRKGSR